MALGTHHHGSGTLFAEDFDLPVAVPPSQPEPEVEPVFSAAELTAAREAGWQGGHAAGLQEASEGDAAATRRAVTALAEQFASAREAAAASAEQPPKRSPVCCWTACGRPSRRCVRSTGMRRCGQSCGRCCPR